MQYVFIMGCARSGTTALRRLINRWPDACILNERYTGIWYGDAAIDPQLFESERVFSVRDSDSMTSQNYLVRREEEIRGALKNAVIVGDKAPRMHRRIDQVREAYPGAKFVYIARNIYDVASSFERRARVARHWSSHRRTRAAIREWNESLENIAQALDDDVFIVCYEEFFGERVGLDALAAFLRNDGLPLTEGKVFRFSDELERRRKTVIPMDGRVEIATQADFKRYRRLLRRWRRQLNHFERDHALDDAPVDASESVDESSDLPRVIADE